MSQNWKLTLIVLAIAIGLSSVLIFIAARRQQQRQTAAMTLIRDLDRIDQRLSQASREFGFALRQYLSSEASQELGDGHQVGSADGDSADARGRGDADKLGALRQSHRALIASVSQSIAVVSELEAPVSEHGADFISAQRKFLLVQRGIIREDFGRLLTVLENTALSAEARLDTIDEIIEGAYRETEEEFTTVGVAREKFAHEFAIHLTPQP